MKMKQNQLSKNQVKNKQKTKNCANCKFCRCTNTEFSCTIFNKIVSEWNLCSLFK